MSNIIEAPITPNGEALVELAIERLRETYPNWNPNPASPEYRMFLAFAEIVAELMILAFDVPEAIIRFVGAVVYQEPIIAATFAEGLVNVVAKDTLGHTIKAGTQVIISPQSEGVNPIGFEFFRDATIPPGSTELLGSGVGGSATLGIIRALEPGPESNITGATATVFDEPEAWVSEIEVVSNPQNGSAEETIEAYTRRIIELARLIAPRPILPNDFANYVRLLTTKEPVARAVAIDLLELKHVTEEGRERTKVNGSGEGEVEAENAERCVTVIAMNSSGEALSTAARKEAEEKVKAAREGTFKFYLAGPSQHSIEVKVKGTFLKGYTEAGVVAGVEEALKNLLNPATWGTPSTGDTTGWTNEKVLRYQKVVAALEGVTGFGHYTELKVNGAEADVTMAGIAPVPKAGTLTITLVEGSE
jgi:hypothetical protein